MNSAGEEWVRFERRDVGSHGGPWVVDVLGIERGLIDPEVFGEQIRVTG